LNWDTQSKLSCLVNKFMFWLALLYTYIVPIER
jgi:hypothetical protein